MERDKKARREPTGEPFAPPEALLWPHLHEKERAQSMRVAGRHEEAEALEARIWTRYREGYIAAMRRSYRKDRLAWDVLLCLEHVVLVCYCPRRERCHRGLLAEILVKLGAEDLGEVAPGETS